MDFDRLVDFLNGEDDFYIEVEGKLNTIQRRIDPNLSENDEGVCVLSDGVNKWGLEYRLYTFNRPAPSLGNKFHSNTDFRHSEYTYRLSDNSLVSSLLDAGFHLGRN